MIVPTPVNCPECVTKGITVRLSRELGADREYFCPNGHRMAEVPGGAAQVAQEAPAVAAGTPERVVEPPTTSRAESAAPDAQERQEGPSEEGGAATPTWGDPTMAVIGSLRDEIEHLQVQLSGCLTAAEGYNDQPAKSGDYGWSLAYQKVLELRLRYEALLKDMPEPSSTGQPADARSGTFKAKSTPVPGGEAVVTLCLPEPVVTALRVEAEGMGKEWPEFLQEHLSYVVSERGGAF